MRCFQNFSADCHIGLRRGGVRIRGTCRRNGALVVLARDGAGLEELFVALQIGIVARRSASASASFADAPARSCEAAAEAALACATCTSPVTAEAVLSACVMATDGRCGIQLRHRLIVLRLGLRVGDLLLAGVEIHQRLPSFDV